MRYAMPRLTPSERASYRRWWIERSGLSKAELVSIAIGLGGDAGFAKESDAVSTPNKGLNGSRVTDTNVK